MRYFIITICLLMFSAPAFAIIKVQNLSSEPKEFAVIPTGKERFIITIQPNETWRFNTVEARVAPIDGKTVQPYRVMRRYDYYVYWPSGVFGLQMRGTSRGRVF